MPLPGSLPYGLGITSGSTSLYTPTGFPYNYAIGGLPFLSAASVNNPYSRATASFRKQQVDQSNEPGEQSLDGWWIRSQQTFHGGAGQLYADPNANDASWAPSRFWRSKGVDPWTPGQASLLRRTDVLTSSGAKTITSDGIQAAGLLNDDDSIYYIDDAGAYSEEDLTVGGTLGLPFGTIESIATDSSRFFVAADTAIYTADIGTLPASAWLDRWFTFEDPPVGVTTTVRIAWVKERLVVATNLGVYELTDFSGSADYLPAANWYPPQGTWTPKSISESNSAIYVAGVVNGNRSIILKFTLDNTGALPVLTAGVVVANLPFGEIIEHIYGYLGFLAISTNRGPRIAAIDTNGDLAVGPLLFSGATGAWAARDQYLFTSAVLPEWEGDEGGLVRIDLGTQHDDLRFAYSSDLFVEDAGTDGAVGAGLTSAGMVVATDGGIYSESTTQYVDSGYLQSSRIRYSTLEPKIFKLVRVRAPLLSGDFSVSVVDDADDEHTVVGYVAGQVAGTEDVLIPSLGPQDFLSVLLTLSTDLPDRLTTPTVSGWQVKAIPGQPRQRQIVLPLLCFDLEQDRNGAEIGFPGYARERLLALEAIEQSGDTQVLQDFDGNDLVTVSIEEVRFTQTAPPARWAGEPANWGGIITLTLRTVL